MISREFIKNFWLGLALFPVWRWLHQSMCPHTVQAYCYIAQGKRCRFCGKEMK